MKKSLIIMTILYLCFATQSWSNETGFPEKTARYVEFLQSKLATREQQSKILFTATVAARKSGLSFDLHNGLIDHEVVGIKIAIKFEPEHSANSQTIMLFLDCKNVSPLSSYAGTENLYTADKIADSEPEITVTEIRIKKIDPKETQTTSRTNSQSLAD